jgi:DNA-directed RNA polymerase subunit omega
VRRLRPGRVPGSGPAAASAGKYQLVIVAAKRARQITAFRTQLGEGLLEYTGPLVTPRREREQPLSIALREIHQGVLKVDTPDYL